VVRYGRILDINNSERGFLRTDNALVGGDSGGPLFDLQGRVIGIHSRIGPSITANMDVPVDTYRDTWERLVNSERWGDGPGNGGGGRRGGRGAPQTPVEPEFGLKLDPGATVCTVGEILKDSPAEKAGLKTGDIVKKFDGKEATTVAALLDEFKKKKPGDEVAFEVQRGSETLTLKVVAGRKPAEAAPRGSGGGPG
jgi:serine protease Do